MACYGELEWQIWSGQRTLLRRTFIGWWATERNRPLEHRRCRQNKWQGVLALISFWKCLAFTASRVVFIFAGTGSENGCAMVVCCIGHLVLWACSRCMQLLFAFATFLNGVERDALWSESGSGAAPDLPVELTGSPLSLPMEQACSPLRRKAAAGSAPNLPLESAFLSE